MSSTSGGGRPTNSEGKRPTLGVRVFKDLGVKLRDIKAVTEKSYAAILDPFIRTDVENLWEEHRKAIEDMHENEAKRKEIIKRAAEAKPRGKKS